LRTEPPELLPPEDRDEPELRPEDELPELRPPDEEPRETEPLEFRPLLEDEPRETEPLELFPLFEDEEPRYEEPFELPERRR
jgi:hypothetical protein